MLISYLLIKTPMTKKRRLLKLFERKKDKRATLWVAKKEAQQSSTKLMKCLSCDRADHAIPSVLNCPYHIKSKTEFTETLAIKSNLNNTCKDANMILKVQKLVPHLTLVVYAGSLFANYFYIQVTT